MCQHGGTIVDEAGFFDASHQALVELTLGLLSDQPE
jgi:hypothetical protein